MTLAATILASQAAYAQGLMDSPIGFRSGLTEGAVTTRPGTLTVDAGASVRWAGDATIWRLGELNVRIPITGRLETRIYPNSYSWRGTPSGSTSGREDAALAAAAMLFRHRGLRPVTTLILRLDAPTGNLSGRSHSWRPGARWSLGWELPGRIALHGNLGVQRETASGRPFARGSASVWLARRLAGPVGSYVEGFFASRERSGGGPASYLHGGLTCLLRPWLHLDFHGGVGSREAGSPRWVGLGVRQRA